MKRSLAVAVLVAAATLTTVPALAAGNAKGNKFQCFDGTTDGGFNGTCMIVNGTAVLNTVDGDANPNNNYAGVYLQNSNLGGKTIGSVNQLAFTFSGDAPTGGSPRLSIPIDEDGDGTWEDFAFIDAVNCSDGAGTVDVINDPTCTVSYEAESFANWAAFVAADPTYRIATDALSFIIADQPGNYTISNVRLGKGPARPAR